MGSLLKLLRPTNLLLAGLVGAGAFFYFRSEFYKQKADHALQAHNYANEERPLMEVEVVGQERDARSNELLTSYLLKPYRDDGTLVPQDEWVRVIRAGRGFIVEANRDASRHTWGAFNPAYVELDRFLGTSEPSEVPDGNGGYRRNGAPITRTRGAPAGYVDPAFIDSSRQQRTIVQRFFDSFHDTGTRIQGEIAPIQRTVAPSDRYLISSNGTGRVISERADNPAAVAAVQRRQEQIRRALDNRPRSFERSTWDWVRRGFREEPAATPAVPPRAATPTGTPAAIGHDGIERTPGQDRP